MLKHFFENTILEHARVVFVIILATIGFLGYPATKLKIDASTETLIMENDEDLRITREISSRYKSPDFLIVTYTPKDGDLLSDNTLDGIRRLRADLLKIGRAHV